MCYISLIPRRYGIIEVLNTLDIDLLLESARSGDAFAERQLFENLRVRFLLFAEQRIGTKEDVEDVVHSALLIVGKKYREVEFERSLTAWAHGVLNNEILRHYRTSSRYRATIGSSLDDIDPPDASNPDPELRRRIITCLDKLHMVYPRYAQVLQLKSEGLDAAAICSRLNIKMGNMYTLVSRARAAFKQCLERGGLSK
jgi:RNA polymerase sigma factor (sigma-70 family)